VVQVIEDKSGDIVYTLRIAGDTFRPPVFTDGPHTIRVLNAPIRAGSDSAPSRAENESAYAIEKKLENVKPSGGGLLEVSFP
jgi:hypothetical protein